MEYNYYTLFLIFFIYAVLGYIVETISVSLIEKEITFNRGFLIGPYLPVFGFGGLIMTATLPKYSKDLVALFIMSMASCLALEYITSYILEKIFKLRWWDYSNKKFNLNGRICLEIGVMFGLAGVISIRIVTPLIEKIFSIIPTNILAITSVVLTIIILIDLYLSTKTIVKFKTSFTRYSKDSTKEIKSKIIEELSKNGFFIKRLLKSFPSATDKKNIFRELRNAYYEKLKIKGKNTK